MEKPESSVEKFPKFRAPLVLDLFLGLALLLACFGFTVGVFHMYLISSASQSINQENYPGAIAILRGAPLPEIFSMTGSETEELLSKALYLDAITKLESDPDSTAALQELSEIRPGSKYYICAQKTIDEKNGHKTGDKSD
ncbi:MAG: hypothetical protein K2W82_12140 [Candidatus Obscuribacterales bacterium]|nr:hypothetical protein [Candidatus Obscuribacterales bacterium]